MNGVSGESTWPTAPLGRLLRSREEFGGDHQLLSLSARHGVRERPEGEGRAASEDLSGYRVVRVNDFVVNRLVVKDGAFAVSAMSGLISPAYWVLRPAVEGVHTGWINYVLRSDHYLHELARLSKFMPPAQFDLGWEQFKSLHVPVPDTRTQTLVVRFLDRELAEMGAVEAQLQRLRTLLDEHWQSSLAVAISGKDVDGLDSHGEPDPAKCRWPLRKLVQLTDPATPIVYGILLPGPRLADGVPYIGAGDVRPDRLDLTHLPRTTQEIAAQYPRSRVRAGELVYAIRGSFGATEQVPTSLDGVNLSRDAARICPASGTNPRWLMYALKSNLAQEQFRRKEVGAMVTGVNIGDLKQVRLPVPPEDEQARIVRLLDRKNEEFVNAREAVDGQLAILAERRQVLITEAVTGKLDLSGVAA